jgi:ubiquinone/menaquinone biosynthesis C-methylase UbiE
MADEIGKAVRDGYGAVARSGLSSHDGGIAAIARAFGYSDDELDSIPAEANMGLSCGNPVAMASIRPGETVVDLGSGGGLDVFLAAHKVGDEGRAIGIDMTADMVALARENAGKQGHGNVEFHHAEITAMPLADNSIDCVISNCVLNLVEDKAAAASEIFRILKPGGRLAISDIALKKHLPDAMRDNMAAWTSCISGAVSLAENRRLLEKAGFSHVEISDTGADLNAYKQGGTAGCCTPVAGEGSSCCGAPSEPAYHEKMGQLIDECDFNEFAASVKIFALKAR